MDGLLLLMSDSVRRKSAARLMPEAGNCSCEPVSTAVVSSTASSSSVSETDSSELSSLRP